MTHNIRAGIVIHRAGDVAVRQLVGKGIGAELQFALRHMRGLPFQLGMLRQQQLANLAGPACSQSPVYPALLLRLTLAPASRSASTLALLFILTASISGLRSLAESWSTFAPRCTSAAITAGAP